MHVAIELLKMQAGIDVVHVPYRGPAPAMTDLMAGQVQAFIITISTAIGFIRSGKLLALAVTGGTRSEILPDVPSVSEVLPGFDATAWDGTSAPKGTPAAVVDLHCHQARRELDDMRLDAEILQRLRRFQTEQAATDDDAALGRKAGGAQCLEILDRAIDEAAVAVLARNRRHERKRTGRQHQLVVGDRLAVGERHRASFAVERRDPGIEAQIDTVGFGKVRARQQQIIGTAARKELGQMHTVVGRPRLFSEDGERDVGLFDERLDAWAKAVKSPLNM